MTLPRPRLPKTRIGKGTAAAAAVVALIGTWEGVRYVAYQDVIGVWTACYGETRGIKPGMKFTPEQCSSMFLPRIQEFETEIRMCLDDPDELPINVYIAALSLSYNIGSSAFCKSTAARRFNADDLKGGCEAIGWFTKAGGKRIPGLVNRRKDEVKFCLEGIQ